MNHLVHAPAVAATILACLIGAASAQPTLPDARLLSSVPAAQRAAFVADWQKRQADQASAAAGKIDHTPPVLTRFHVAVPADNAGPLAQVIVDMASTDDLSGIAGFGFMLVGPDGQVLNGGNWAPILPSRKYSTRFAIDVSAYTEAGAWTVSMLTLVDYANNWVSYTAGQLASLGNANVTLANSRTDLVDLSPPVLVSGVVTTPSVSISTPLKGTATVETIFGASFVVKDVGTSTPSGPSVAFTTWCLRDSSNCISLTADERVNGLARTTEHLYGQYDGSPVTGEYVLETVALYDHAGNATFLTGTEFGGTTDFTALLPAGHSITLTP